mmetsp:Transcript_40804/g.135080  ORF Transcript_40804/g.135080 Transcript_40804/m.135080 type:complete len:481 (+) Transcript_40804:1175-2617(+)
MRRLHRAGPPRRRKDRHDIRPLAPPHATRPRGDAALREPRRRGALARPCRREGEDAVRGAGGAGGGGGERAARRVDGVRHRLRVLLPHDASDARRLPLLLLGARTAARRPEARPAAGAGDGAAAPDAAGGQPADGGDDGAAAHLGARGGRRPEARAALLRGAAARPAAACDGDALLPPRRSLAGRRGAPAGRGASARRLRAAPLRRPANALYGGRRRLPRARLQARAAVRLPADGRRRAARLCHDDGHLPRFACVRAQPALARKVHPLLAAAGPAPGPARGEPRAERAAHARLCGAPARATTPRPRADELLRRHRAAGHLRQAAVPRQNDGDPGLLLDAARLPRRDRRLREHDGRRRGHQPALRALRQHAHQRLHLLDGRGAREAHRDQEDADRDGGARVAAAAAAHAGGARGGAPAERGPRGLVHEVLQRRDAHDQLPLHRPGRVPHLPAARAVPAHGEHAQPLPEAAGRPHVRRAQGA